MKRTDARVKQKYGIKNNNGVLNGFNVPHFNGNLNTRNCDNAACSYVHLNQ